MGDIDRIEAARGGPFRFRIDGQTVECDDPRNLHFQEVLAILQDPRQLLERRMPEWKRSVVAQAWAAHYDLPSFEQARRLCYLVDRYADALTYDLHAYANVDLRDLWQSRRWSTLLAIIDRLPATSTYSVAVTSDEEHSKMLADALAEREKGDEPSGPSLATWSPEVDVLTSLRDDVRVLQFYVRATSGDKSAKPPKPLPRPVTPMQKAMADADFRRKQAKHKTLVARMLPHKRDA